MSLPNELLPIGLLGTGTGAAVEEGYNIERSVRLNSADSAYLNRTPASAGNQKTYTYSVWLKRADVATGAQNWFTASPTSLNYVQFRFEANKIKLYFKYNGGTQYVLDTVALFRDTSAWYHVVVAVDSTQATSTDRVKIYVNGVNTPYTGTVFAQNTDTTINSAVQHSISSYQPYGSGTYFNGYLADIHFIDGQALAATDFGEFDATTGVWNPKEYTGTYGTNGFHLPFSDNSSNAALGTDTSGNGHTWTVNNISAATGGPTSVAAASGALPIYNTTDTYGAVKGTGTRTDSNSSSLVLALPMDGANNSTTFTDESATIKGSGTAKTVTANGNTRVSTAQSKYYGSSGYFDGSGDYLSVADNDDFELGSGNFTLEAWVYLTGYSANYSGNYNAIILAKDSGSTGRSFTFAISGTASSWTTVSVTLFTSTSPLVYTGNTGSFNFSLNTWYHVAVVRNGTSVRLYVNGNDVGGGTNSTNTASTTTSLIIGAEDPFYQAQGFAYYFPGYINDLRIYKGSAKYTSNFIPPSITQDTTIADDCDSLVDVPTNGTETDTGFGGEVRGNYCTWNPLDLLAQTLSNGNLQTAGSTNLACVTGTIGVTSGKWYWEVTAGSAQGAYGIWSTASRATTYPGGTADSYSYYGSSGNKYNNNLASSYGASFTTGDVIGIALDLDAGTLTYYKNNVSQGVAFTGLTGGYRPAIRAGSALGASTDTHVNFGQRPFAYDISIGISDATGATPVLSTSDEYGQTLSSGTATDSDSANLVLALPMNGSNGGTTFTDYSATIKGSGSAKTVTPSGDVKTSTVQSKYYGSSGYFDGAGDYLTSPTNTDFEFGTGDFTVELWAFFNTLTRLAVTLGTGASGNGTARSAWSMFYYPSGNEFYFYRFDGSSTIYTFPFTPSTSTWYHIAVSRSGTSLRFFVDGVQIGSTVTTSVSYNAVNTQPLTINKFISGSSDSIVEYFNGYIQDLRIYKGAAKYTSNFIPPSSALYKALCTTNLPAPTIANGSEYMDVALYTGNGSTQTISGLNFSPDFVWIKRRDGSGQDHVLQDSVRGFTSTTKLSSSSTLQENAGTNTATSPQWGYISGASPTGFDIAASTSGDQVNKNTWSYVAWTWDAGSSTVTNNDGSITSQVRANTSAGFSVIGWTGASSGTASIGHGLGVAPAMVIARPRNATSNWVVYHRSVGNDAFLRLNTTDASVSSSACFGTGPTSTVFTLNQGSLFAIAGNCIGYAFAPVTGYSSFGSYTGNGSTDGTFVYTGFRPRWVLYKKTNSTGVWCLYDSARSSHNEANVLLQAQSTSAELSYPSDPNVRLDILSNGFKLRNSSSSQNASGSTYIYAAFAESPFSLARAR